MKNRNTFKYSSEFDFSDKELFDWHENPGAFERLNPPWQKVRVTAHSGGIRDEARVSLKIPAGLVSVRWHLKHKNYRYAERFEDEQLRGPFKYWRHQHIFLRKTYNKSKLSDFIEYELPLGIFGKHLLRPAIDRKLTQLFRFRHRRTKNDMESHKTRGKKMKIVISGSSGLLGKRLTAFLSTGGHQIVKLVRNKDQVTENSVFWNPAAGQVETDRLENADAFIHLSGENVGSGYWTQTKKRRIKNSRIDSTRLLSQTISNLKFPPKIFLSASAVGFYGDRGEEILTEQSSKGSGFFPEVCEQWEKEAQQADPSKTRVVNMRFGIILDPAGGTLAKLYLPTKLGLGAVFGNGKQFMPWIAIDDVLYAINFILNNPNISGAVNLAAPNPVNNRQFTKTLARVLKRPALFSIPAAVLKLALREMATEMLLSGARVQPAVLQQNGYEFKFPDLEKALRFMYGKAE